MALITLTFGSNGRQYPGLQEAWNAIPADVIASGNSYELVGYNDSELVVGSVITLSNKNTDAGHTITIRPAAGHSFRDNANVQNNAYCYNPANGLAIKQTAWYTNVVNLDNDYVTITGIQFQHAGGGNSGSAVYTTSTRTHTLLDNCIFDINPSGFFVIAVQTPGVIRNCAIILRASTSHGVSFFPNVTATAENVTLIRTSDRAAGGYAFDSAGGGPTVRNCAAFNFGSFDASGNISSGSNNASNTTINFGTNNKQNLVGSDHLVSLTTTAPDLRLKAGSSLIDAGAPPTAGNTLAPSGSRQQGSAADIGAWEYPQVVQSPTATITNINVTGQTVTITGTTTGTPTSGSCSIAPTNTAYNQAVAKGPNTVTFGSGTFTVQFTGVKVGQYSVAMTVANANYTVGATNSVGTFNVLGAYATSVIQDAVDGQILTIHGTTAGVPTSGALVVPAAATNPNGALDQTVAVTLGSGTFTVSVTLSPGNYDASRLTFTNAAGTSLPQSGTTPVSVIGIGGNPQAPDLPSDTTAPTMQGVLTSANITQTSYSISWQAATDGVAVTGYEFSTDGTNYVDIGNTPTYLRNSLTQNTTYQNYVRAYDAAHNKSEPLSLPVKTASSYVASVNIKLFTAGAPAVNLSGLRWAWFDQVDPSLFAAPTDKGAVESTDDNGNILITLPNSVKTLGQVGWLIVTDSVGNPTNAYKAFSGPIAVS